MKSKHIIYYVFNYQNIDDKKLNKLSKQVYEDNDWFYKNFTNLYNDDKLLVNYKLDDIINSEVILKNEYKEDVSFVLTNAILRISKKFKTGIIELYLDNHMYDNFEHISRHLFKNESFNKTDSFGGIYLNDKQFITEKQDISISENLINDVLLDNIIDGFRLSLGRRNYQIMTIISDYYSTKVHTINDDRDLSIYRLATGEINTSVGSNTYNKFLDTTYDKWVYTGSLYIIDDNVMLQILDEKNASFYSAPHTKYNYVVSLCLLQKAIFIKFQNVFADMKQRKLFNTFLSKFYFIEVSHDSQTEEFYLRLKEELKLNKYHEIVKDEINLMSDSNTTSYLVILTFLYTTFALISVLMMI